MKTITRFFTGLALVSTLALHGCLDDEFPSPFLTSVPVVSGSTRAVDATSSLKQNSDGTWTATRRVPLVGEGRVVDNYSPALVSALSGNSRLEDIVDTDLGNAASFGGGLAAVDLLANQIVSVRDLNRTYAAGQVVGFTFKVADSGLLTVDVLKGFWLQTFKDGVEQESYGGDVEVEVLDLNVISIANNDGLREISFKTQKDFDEVKFNIYGISAELLQSLSVCYAFVGDNEIKTVTSGSLYYPDASLHENGWTDLGWTSMLNAGYVVDNDTTNYGYFGTLSELFNDPCVTVRFGKEVPAGTEVGFETSSVNLLTIGIGTSIILATYDDNDEEQDKVSNTGVIGISAISGGRSRISMVTTKPCTQLYIDFAGLNISLGGSSVYYAYTRDAVGIDVSSYFTATDVTISGNSYTLRTPEGGATQWNLLSAPEGSQAEIVTKPDGTTQIVGMTVNGDYLLSGTYTPEGGKPTTVVFTVTREAVTMGTDCDQLIGTSYGAVAEKPLEIGTSGSALTIFEDLENVGNIVDDDRDSYASYTKGVGLGFNLGIVAVQLKTPVNPGKEKVKVGFTLQNSFDFLSADLLTFFVIKLYKDGKEVDESAADDSAVADVGLIEGKTNKFRIGFTTTATFDRIELWTAGVVSLNIKSFRLYNAYWESAEDDASCPTGGLDELCMELLTSAHGAEINYSETKSAGLASVGGSFNNLGNLLDDDDQSYATITNEVNLIGETTVAVKFEPMNHGRVGFIVKSPDYVASADLLAGTSLHLYYQGKKVAESSTGGLLDLGAIGYTGRSYVETEIPREQGSEAIWVDEVRITFAGTISLLDNIYLYGAYVRRDTDGDGIPDCAEDEENPSQPTEQLTAEIRTPHLCENDSLVIHVTEGGTVDDSYELVCYNTSLNNEKTVITQKLASDNTFTIGGLKAGRYYIRIQKGGKNVCGTVLGVDIHPLQTTWQPQHKDTGWNTWDNWTDGAPWTCTDVIIPGNCDSYPVLKADEENNCARLHVAYDGEIVHTQYLDHYDYAWVELSLQPGCYYMLSAPLQQMVTGDFFVPARFGGDHSREAYFTGLSFVTTPESRFTPRVFQRFWSSTAPGKIVGENGSLQTVEVNVDETNWTAPFNAVAEPYRAGMGFSVRTDGAATFRFPKTHTEYTYFDGAGNSTGLAENIARMAGQIGRLLTDEMEGKDSYAVTVRNLTEGDRFVVGNPFLAHIDVKAFLKANPDITSVTVNDGNANVTMTFEEGELKSSGTVYPYIPPMTAFYVAATAGTELSVTFTAAMQKQMPGYEVFRAPSSGTRALTRGSGSGDDRNTLRLTATCGGHSSSCMVRLSPSADDAFRTGEDLRLLLDADMMPTVAVFTVADGQALEIQRRRGGTEIPVGIRLKQKAKVTLTLTHAAGDDWSGWTLVDRVSGHRYPLDEDFTYVDLGVVDTQVGRLCLMKDE